MLSRDDSSVGVDDAEDDLELTERRVKEITRRTDLPEEVVAKLRQMGIDEEALEVAVSADVGEDGTFGEKWLTATSDRLLTLSPDRGNARVHLDLPLKIFREFVAEPQVGNGIIEGYTHDGQLYEIIRYSNALSRQFPQVAKHLQTLIEGKGEEFTPDARIQESICPHCGQVLQHGSLVCPRCLNKSKTLRRLLRYAWNYKGYLICVWIVMLIGIATNLTPPYISRILVDSVLTSGINSSRLLAALVLILAASQLIGVLLRIVQQRLTSVAAISITYDVRRHLFASLQRQSLGFFDKRRTGNLMSRVTNDTRKLLNFLTSGIRFLVVNVLTIIGIGVMLFVINWELALYILIPVPIVFLLTKLFWRTVKAAHYRVHVRWAQISGILNDSLSGIKVVKAFGQEGREIRRFDDTNTGLFSAGLDEAKISQTLFPILAFVSFTGSLLIWWVGGRKVMAQEVTLGTLVAFLGYLGMFYAPVQTLSKMGTWLTRSLTAAERVFEVMDARQDVREVPHPKRLRTVDGRFEFKNVTFGYDVNTPVLEGVNLQVEPGVMLGLVGRSGAGKSTLINLICRFYDVTEGQILLDGIDLRELSLEDYRAHLGVVLQEPFLFSGSVYENIAYPKPQAKLEEVMNAAKLANAHEFILGFQDGYDTQVGERGGRLSGGERQRLAIARAILHNPKILILDEATASVDTQTESLIQEALARLVRGRTVFAIAHRLSTLRNADRLIVIDEGKIVETGTHEELLLKRGLYEKLVRLQTELNRIKALAG